MEYQETKIVHLHADQPEQTYIEEAARLIRQGQLVVFPTETVYGLGADALQTQAIEKIFAAKERPFSDPLIVHIDEEEGLHKLVTHVPETAHLLARQFWPGPLTLILPAGPRVPKMVTSGLPNVAIRMPHHPIARALIKAAGTPIAAPSANRFMHVSPTTAQHAYADLKGRVLLILDGGPCEVGVESTVLDLCAPVPRILRPGGVSLEALRNILPEVLPPQPRQPGKETREQAGPALPSPGQMLIHYSPSVPTFLFEGTPEAIRLAMLAEIRRRQETGEQVGVLVANEDRAALRESGANIYALGDTAEEVAAHLFAGLRVLEEAGVNAILCRTFTTEGLGLAIRDRLLKAAGGKIIIC